MIDITLMLISIAITQRFNINTYYYTTYTSQYSYLLDPIIRCLLFDNLFYINFYLLIIVMSKIDIKNK